MSIKTIPSKTDKKDYLKSKDEKICLDCGNTFTDMSDKKKTCPECGSKHIMKVTEL